MAGEFTTWGALLVKAKDAIARGDISKFMVQTIENSREMRTVSSNLRDVTAFISYLEAKATEEALGCFDGQMFFTELGGEG